MATELLGRADALAALRDGLAAARAGHGRMVVVAGEAGIGKTALVDAFARESGDCVRGRAWELAEAPPYFPLWPCLRALDIEVGDRTPFEMWEAVLSALAAASAERDVVWIVEDLHVADQQTLDLLAFLARPLGALRVLVVVTTRVIGQRIARMSRDGVELVLEPLGRDDVAALGAACAGKTLAPAMVERLLALTGGNPFFVTQCARSIERTDLPATVREAIVERVALLPAECRRMLTIAAILGRDVAAAHAGKIASASPAQVIDALEPAVVNGLIDPSEPGRYRFRHVLVRDAIEDAASAELRVSLHTRAERVLAAESETPEVLVERARHALEAGSADALALARRAAAWLEAHGAFDRAFAMHERIELARRAGLLPAASPGERLDLARIARDAGRHADALRICDEVAAHARATGDAILLGRAAWQRGAELRPGAVDPALVGVLEEALAIVPESEVALRCRLLARLSGALQPHAEDVWIPVARARDAIARARALGDDGVLRDVLLFAAGALVDVAPLEERIAASRELLEMSGGDVSRALRALSRLAVDRVEQGDFVGFDADVERMLDLSSATGLARHRWQPLLFASMRALMYGQLDRSERLVTEVAELAGVTDDPSLGLSLAAHRMRRARLMHHDEDMLSALEDYKRAMQGVPRGEMLASAFRLGCLARMRDVAAVADELSRLGAVEEALWKRGFHAWLAEAYVLAGSDAQRRRAREFFASVEDRELVVSHVAITYEGPVRRLLGLLDASLGDVAAGERALVRAASSAQARGHRPWVAQLRFDLATILPASRRADADALYAEAGALARDIGMTGLARRAGDRATETPAPSGLCMVPEGELWRIEHDGKVHTLRDTRGMQLLARLVERPREEVHVLALASDEGVELTESNAGGEIDVQARREYRERLRELGEELADAEACADLGRMERLAAEKEALERELFRALGLGGQARRARSTSERARVNVQRRLKDAISRISEVAPVLGAYLSKAIRTGTYCSFRP